MTSHKHHPEESSAKRFKHTEHEDALDLASMPTSPFGELLQAAADEVIEEYNAAAASLATPQPSLIAEETLPPERMDRLSLFEETLSYSKTELYDIKKLSVRLMSQKMLPWLSYATAPIAHAAPLGDLLSPYNNNAQPPLAPAIEARLSALETAHHAFYPILNEVRHGMHYLQNTLAQLSAQLHVPQARHAQHAIDSISIEQHRPSLATVEERFAQIETTQHRIISLRQSWKAIEKTAHAVSKRIIDLEAEQLPPTPPLETQERSPTPPLPAEPQPTPPLATQEASLGTYTGRIGLQKTQKFTGTLPPFR